MVPSIAVSDNNPDQADSEQRSENRQDRRVNSTNCNKKRCQHDRTDGHSDHCLNQRELSLPHAPDHTPEGWGRVRLLPSRNRRCGTISNLRLGRSLALPFSTDSARRFQRNLVECHRPILPATYKTFLVSVRDAFRRRLPGCAECPASPGSRGCSRYCCSDCGLPGGTPEEPAAAEARGWSTAWRAA